MIKKIISYKLLVMSFMIFLAYSYAYAQSLSSTELITNAAQYDGRLVVYAGEVIGEVMVRGDYGWVNLNDGLNAIGIWLDKSLLKEIVYSGSYQAKGDWLEAAGIFHRACPEHGGDLDIHAKFLRKISSGKVSLERLNPEKRKIALILLGVLCLVLILCLFKKPFMQK